MKRYSPFAPGMVLSICARGALFVGMGVAWAIKLIHLRAPHALVYNDYWLIGAQIGTPVSRPLVLKYKSSPDFRVVGASGSRYSLILKNIVMPVGELLWLMVALAALIVSGRYLVRFLMVVTRSFGIPEFSVGFVLLAVSTSLPEIFVGIASARQEAASLVLATALGSNIVNMTFIVGLAAILSLGIKTSGLNVRRDLVLGGAITMLPILFLADATITRFEGILLLAAFWFYVWQIYRDRRRSEQRSYPGHLGHGVQALAMIGVLIVVLLVAAEITVRSATSIATELQLPTFLIGLFILAFGTSLPELVTTLNAAMLRRPSLALGNILGSNVADSGIVIGLAALTHPLTTALTPDLIVTALFVLLSLLIIGWFAYTRKRLSMAEGIGLVLVFCVFGILLFGVSTYTV